MLEDTTNCIEMSMLFQIHRVHLPVVFNMEVVMEEKAHVLVITCPARVAARDHPLTQRLVNSQVSLSAGIP
jgi:hypothetical protein